MSRRVQPRARQTAVGLLTLTLGVITVLLTGTGAAASPYHHPSGSYVALGDSYASGEGLAPYEEGTPGLPASCDQSVDDSYPVLLEQGPLHAFDRLSSAACSGAVTTSLLVTLPGSGAAPQLAAVTPRTRTVSVTIGGNDAGFSEVLTSCIYPTLPSPAARAQMARAAIAGGPGCRGRLNHDVTERIANLARTTGDPALGSTSLPEVIAAIQDRAPRARIYVSTYPQLIGRTFPATGGCVVGHLGPADLVVAADDARWIREKATELDAAIALGVRRAHRAGDHAQLVDVSGRFDGHNVCDSRAPWLNPVVIGATGLDPASFHPTARGQRSYANAFAAAVRR